MNRPRFFNLAAMQYEKFTNKRMINAAVSCAAVLRWSQRQAGFETEHPVAVFFDQHFDNRWMEHHYPNMKFGD